MTAQKAARLLAEGNQETLDGALRELLRFAARSETPLGFGTIGKDGRVDPNAPLELWINCRMTYVFSLATMMALPGAQALAAHGVRGLTKYFHDDRYGGWYSAIAPRLEEGKAVPVNDSKEAYAHAFVLLAATAAQSAEIPGADLLYDEAVESQRIRWFDPTHRRVVEAWDRSFESQESYRGANSNMHTVEAYLAASDAAGDLELLDNALSILEFFYNQAKRNGWRLPEHFDSDWQVELDYNRDNPADPFRPFGVTPGHGMEWARLMLHARNSLLSAGRPVPEWLLEGANEMFNRAVEDSWSVDGQPGFVYTTDFEGAPVVRARMHWVAAEALGAGIVLAQTLNDGAGDWSDSDRAQMLKELEANLGEWWQFFVESHLEAPGQWIHELDENNVKSEVTWPGKPDAYHVAQLLLLPRLGASPTFAAALATGYLDAQQ